MYVEIVDNYKRTHNMAVVLSQTIAPANDTRIAVAFISRAGLKAIESGIMSSLEAGGTFEFLVGLDGKITDPRALKFLYELVQQNTNVSLYCYTTPEKASIYHPKVYLLQNANQITAIVGSSNLTVGGLKTNIEANVLLHGTGQDEAIDDLYSTYARLKFQPGRVIPDEETLDLYAQAYRGARKAQAANRKTKDDVVTRLEEKLKTLRPPKVARRDLTGWRKLIYDIVPEGEFTNQQIYAFEAEFQQHYPDNKEIKAKIRQQLQQLRDIGLIEYVSRARWRKRPID